LSDLKKARSPRSDFVSFSEVVEWTFRNFLAMASEGLVRPNNFTKPFLGKRLETHLDLTNLLIAISSERYRAISRYSFYIRGIHRKFLTASNSSTACIIDANTLKSLSIPPLSINATESGFLVRLRKVKKDMFDGNCEIRRALLRPDGLTQMDMRSAPDFEWNWFLSSKEQSREVLAIALTAIATGKKVCCVIDDPSVAFAPITQIGLVK
jgi:hypothetical protein